MIYNVGLISVVQQSGSVIYTCIHSFYILFHYGLSQDVEYSSLCYMASLGAQMVNLPVMPDPGSVGPVVYPFYV